MHRLRRCFTFIAAVAILGGCEWDSPDDSGTWSSSYTWINFAGTYVPAAGASYLVSEYSGATPQSNISSATHPIGTGNGLQLSFSGTLPNRPVVPGSVSVAAGSVSIADSDGNGTLDEGNGSGTVDFTTGAIAVQFDLDSVPVDETTVLVSYNYYVSGSSENPSAGDNPEIYSLVLQQTGQQLVATDSNGITYSGTITGVSQGGGDTTGGTSGTVVANFTLTGSDSSKIVGTLTGTYTAPATGTDANPSATGTLANRTMAGTYVGANGGTGSVSGAGGTVSVSTASTTTTSSSS
ncbi:MAG: hypothetical protein HN341_07845 [Verrucomicrobia bacterium]|jgi:hypothetical protein|nr:hypothetical protein [Verrucomicrobiota bacterium]